MKVGILATLTLPLLTSISLFADVPQDNRADFTLVKKDFINGEINSERESQIILKDPRLVPVYRGGLKYGIDANSDGLGVLVFGKKANGSVGSISLTNDNEPYKANVDKLIQKYGIKAKEAEMSILDYLNLGISNETLSSGEIEELNSIFQDDGLTNVTLESNNYSPELNSVVTYLVTTEGNSNNSPLTYNWTVSNNVDVQSDNGAQLVVTYNNPGGGAVSVNVSDPDSTPISKTINFNVPEPVTTIDGATNPSTVNILSAATAQTDAVLTSGFGAVHKVIDGSLTNNTASNMFGTSSTPFMVNFQLPAQAKINKYRINFDSAITSYTSWKIYASNSSFSTVSQVQASGVLLDSRVFNETWTGDKHWTDYFTFGIDDAYTNWYIVVDSVAGPHGGRCSEIEMVPETRDLI